MTTRKTTIWMAAILAPLGIVGFAGETAVPVLGYLEPYRSISMNPAEPGVIDEIHVAEGDPVKEGQPLLNLNLRVLRAQLAIAQVQADSIASIQLAEADLEVAKDRNEKLDQLRRSGTAHSSELARAEAELKKAEAQLVAAKESKLVAEYRVEEIESQIEQRILRSPIEGVVLEINREIAESTSVAQEGVQNRPLVKVAQIDRLRLVVHMPAAQAGSLAAGQTLPVRALSQSSLSEGRELSGEETSGVVEFVSPTMDPSTETVRVRLVLENSDGRLTSGSHALVLMPR